MYSFEDISRKATFRPVTPYFRSLPVRFTQKYEANVVSTIEFTSLRLSGEKDKTRSLHEILSDLDAVMASDEYDGEFIRPNTTAYHHMSRLLRETNAYVTGNFPLGTVYPDGDGGLRLEWIRPNCELRLVVPVSDRQPAYIYHQRGADYGADFDISPRNLGKHLNWLNEYGG